MITRILHAYDDARLWLAYRLLRLSLAVVPTAQAGLILTTAAAEGAAVRTEADAQTDIEAEQKLRRRLLASVNESHDRSDESYRLRNKAADARARLAGLLD